MYILGFNFFSARALSVIAAILTNLFLIAYAYRKTKSEQAAIVTSLLFIFNGQAISWLVTTKTYSLAMLFLLATFILLTDLKKINIFLAVFIASCCIPEEDEQYFVMCVPFLIILSYKFIQETMLREAGILYPFSVALLILYIVFSAPSTGLMGGLLISPDRDDWASGRSFTREYIEKVSQKVKEVTQANDIVLSWWPGDVFWAGRNNFPGMENKFGYFYASDKIPRELAKQYRIATDSDLIKAIKDNIPKAVILNYSYPFKDRRRSLEKHLKDNYLPLERIGQTVIYISKKKRMQN